MKSGVVFLLALLCELALTEVYYDQSGYGYGVNPKPSGLVGLEDKGLNPITNKKVTGSTTEPIAPQESKPEAYLVRLKPKEAQDSSLSPNKKSKFLLLLRLPEDHEETQATSLNSEVQQRDEQSYSQSQPIAQNQDYPSSGSSQQSAYPFENQKDEASQYQPQQPQIGQQQQSNVEEAELGQQNDSGYQQPLQTDGYGPAQNVDQVQQKDDAYNQQQTLPLPPLPPQQQQQDLPEEFDQQAKDDYQQQQPQQESGYGQLPVPSPAQFQASALKNGFSPLLNYNRQQPQGLPTDSVKGSRNNFFRSPVLQDSGKTSAGAYGSSDSQSRDEGSYGSQREAVKGQALQPQTSYGSSADSGRKSSNPFVPSGVSRDSTKASFQPSSSPFHPTADQNRKSVPQTSSYPSQKSPMKSPAQVYAQQQQQIEQSRKTTSNTARDFFGKSAQPESNSFADQQQSFSSGYGSNEESTKSAAPAPQAPAYEAPQGVKTQSQPLATPSTPAAQVKQSYGQTSSNSDEYSNTYNSQASLARAPFSASVSAYESEQPEQQLQQDQQANQQEEYNQPEQAEDTQEKDEQSKSTPDQQQNIESEKKVPVILISLPPGSNSYQETDNQQKDEVVEPQQPQQTDSDYQQSSGPSSENYESNFNGPVKGQSSPSSFEQNTQSLGSYGQQSESSGGLKSPVQQYSTKSTSPSKPQQQSPVDASSVYPAGGQTKGGRPQQSSPSGVKGNQQQQQSNFENDYSNLQSSPKSTKSVQSTKVFQPVKGGRNQQQQQSTDDSYSNEQQQSQGPVKGSSQSAQDNVKSTYSAGLQAPVKAARAFQQSAGFSSEFQSSTKGASDSYSNQQQQSSSPDSGYNDYQSSPVQQQQSQPEQPEQQTQANLGLNNLQGSTKGGRGFQSQQIDSGYQSSQDSDNSDYQSSSVKGSAPPTQQQTSFGYSSAFSAPTIQQTSLGYESNSYHSSADGVKGDQRSPVQPQQPQQQQQQQPTDAFAAPNPTSQPAFASFAASVKGSAPPSQQTQTADDGYSSGFQASSAPVAPVQQIQSDRGYSSGVKSASPSSSGVKGGQQSPGYSSQNTGSYEQSPLSSSSQTKSAPREPKVALVIPTYRTKSGRSQLVASTKSSNPTSSYNQKSSNSGYSTFSAPSQPQQQQDTKSPARQQPNTKSLLSTPSTSYLPALSPPGSSKSPVQPSKSSSPSSSPSYLPFPMKSQQQSSKSLPLTQGLPPSPALVARSRPSQNFNFPSSQSQNQQSSQDSYPSYSASSNSPTFDDEEDQMSITPDAMGGAYGLRTSSPYDSASASSHIRAVEQPQGSGRVVLLLFDKSQINAQRSQMAFNSPELRGVYKS